MHLLAVWGDIRCGLKELGVSALVDSRGERATQSLVYPMLHEVKLGAMLTGKRKTAGPAREVNKGKSGSCF